MHTPVFRAVAPCYLRLDRINLRFLKDTPAALSSQIKKAANAAFNKTVPNFLSCRFGSGFLGAGGIHNFLCAGIERMAL
jgi:hypothetical protein